MQLSTTSTPYQAELLIFTCSPRNVPSQADDEAARVSRRFPALMQRGGTAMTLCRLLLENQSRKLLLIGHIDERFSSPETNLGFANPSGGLTVLTPSELSDMLKMHASSSGRVLELVVLNGSCSEPHGRAALAAGVPAVVCWRTRLLREAAPLFSEAFFQALARGLDCQMAFDLAGQEVQLTTQPGELANGQKTHVPKYELRDPDGSAPLPHDYFPAPVAVGIPLLLLPHMNLPQLLPRPPHVPPARTALPPPPSSRLPHGTQAGMRLEITEQLPDVPRIAGIACCSKD